MLAGLVRFAAGYIAADGGTCGEHGCWSHGTCLKGICQCEAGYAGSNCREVLDDLCPNNCGGHGRCNEAAAPPMCECHAGYTGYDCTFVLPGVCAGNCGGHGKCVANNRTQSAAPANVLAGTCACDAGFAGASCEVATAACPGHCSGHGECVAGECACHPGFSGKMCNVLATGEHACTAQCSGKGFCRVAEVGGGAACACEPGIGGQGCEQVVPHELCPHNCSAHGVCRADGCLCLDALEYRWHGAGCEVLKPVEGCPSGCSGHGTCAATKGRPGHGLCACHDGFGGAACEQELHCANRCNGPSHGRCVGGRCECEPEWKGAGCAEPRCPLDCSQHGACLAPSVEGGRASCLCDGGWTGLGCDTWQPWCPNECSAHGACTDGRCVCEPGFVGADCAGVEGAAPSAAARWSQALLDPTASTGAASTCDSVHCNAHGRCLVNATLLCACYAGWGGAACDRYSRGPPNISSAEVQALVRKNENVRVP